MEVRILLICLYCDCQCLSDMRFLGDWGGVLFFLRILALFSSLLDSWLVDLG